MRLVRNTEDTPFKTLEVSRPWGMYGLYSLNENCTTKILYVHNGGCLSMQYHFKRDQLYIILDDSFEIQYSTEPVPQYIQLIRDDDKRSLMMEKFLMENLKTEIVRENEALGFRRLFVHRARYLGPRPVGRILDVAFGKNDEEDIIRIKDDYGRA